MTERRIVTDAEAEHERLIARGVTENPITSSRVAADSYVIIALLDTREVEADAMREALAYCEKGEAYVAAGVLGRALERLRGDA